MNSEKTTEVHHSKTAEIKDKEKISTQPELNHMMFEVYFGMMQ